MENEYGENDYEETSYVMESRSISIGDFQGEEFTIGNENKNVKEDWVLSII